ncbi:Acyl carrier protein phosphodiesterase [Halioglobus japonicus]|nr:Acyl carrier protein phosphodiesterase [Halioglobus japonicus]
MNFLAHFHLAWPDEGLVAGGLEGDYVKGLLRGQMPENLERGVKLHRAIDAYTDAHPLILQLRRELPPNLRRYAGILIDLSFDHYLSLHWSRFSELPLAEFNRAVVRILQAHESDLSDGSRAMVARIVEHDILNLYQQWETVPAAAARIGQRFSRQNPFLNLDSELSPARDALEQTFLAFYPQLEFFCKDAIERL